MFKRTHGILTAAAVAVFSSGSMLFAEPVQPVPTPPPAAETRADAQANPEQQISQQLEEFQKQPETALDKLFVLETAIGGMCEVQFAQQAAQKSQSAEIKDLAQRLVADHEKMNQQLQQVAQQLGVKLPTSLPHMKQQELQLFGSLSGRQYDQHFIVHMHAAHMKNIVCFKAAAQLSPSPQVKQFAQDSLPTLRAHHELLMKCGVASGIEQGDDAIPAGAKIPANTDGKDVAPAASKIPGNTGAR